MRVLAILLMIVSSGKNYLDAHEYFKIRVVDSQTGRGVPLIELRTVHNIRYLTDSSGIVAFHEPGLMGKRVFFHISGHGYEFPSDRFGNRGKALLVKTGESVTIKIERKNIAERLYRITGAGIYRDTVLLGEKPPVEKPLLNALVFGSDSVVNAVYRNRIYWFWGDTNRPSYPLGNFHVPGATTKLPSQGGLDPSKGIDLKYFIGANGFAKATANMPGQGPTWINGLFVLKDKAGKERMFAKYVKVKKPMVVYEQGLVEFDGVQKVFVKRRVFDIKSELVPSGHPIRFHENGIEYLYFADPFPQVRVPANVEAILDPTQYEVLTPIVSKKNRNVPELDRDAHGNLRFRWRKNSTPLTLSLAKKLVNAKQLKEHEYPWVLSDIETGKRVVVHRGSIYWNQYRKRWVMICIETFGGPSFLGEVWYAEGDTPGGSWAYARKIVTHNKYSFYNPKQHPMLAGKNGRIVFFEGTYTNMFSSTKVPTPRYNYNQIMYRLDLADSRLVLPVPVYEIASERQIDGSNILGTRRGGKYRKKLGKVLFFAVDRPSKKVVPYFTFEDKNGDAFIRCEADANGMQKRRSTPLFYAISSVTKERPSETIPLYEFQQNGSTVRRYRTFKELPGYTRSKQPLCYVWKTPKHLQKIVFP